jgi:primosomal protein N' (replication factor Y)
VAAVRANRAAGRQTLVVAPSERVVAELAEALGGIGADGQIGGGADGRMGGGDGPATVGRLVAGDGAEARLEAYWAAASGRVDVLIGTRAAAFAPLARPGLAVLVGDGDPALAEPRAPYPNARVVLAVRAGQEGASLLIAGLGRTVQSQALVASGWIDSIGPPRSLVRAATPVVNAPTVEDLAAEGTTAASRLPAAAFRLIRRRLVAGPVLIQVPSAGHEVFGLVRTAAEMARAFPAAKVERSSAGTGLLARTGPEPALVVATPGAEPVAEGGYAAAVLLDAGAWAARAELDAAVDALRIWMGAASLVRARGEVLLLGSDGAAAAQAFVRWDPIGLAERELAERRELGLPPVAKAVVLTGPRGAVDDLVAALGLPDAVRALPAPDKTVLLIPPGQAKGVVREIRRAVEERALTRRLGGVRVKVDGELG